MSAIIGALRAVMSLDSAAFEKGFDEASQRMGAFVKSANKVGKQVQRVGGVMSAGITAPLAVAAKRSVDLFKIQEDAMAKVEQAVKSTGGTAGFTADELFKVASGLQDITRFGDEDILSGVTAQLLTFTNVTGEQFERAQMAALDLATLLGTDLKSATIQLGKALNDPVANLSALSRSGIQFSEDQKELIKSLAEAGRMAEAQSVILDELANQYGGQATAAAETFAGQQDQLRNALGDVQEEFGAIIVSYLPPFVEGMKSLADALKELSPEAKQTIVVVGGIAAAIGPVLVVTGTLLRSLGSITAAFKTLAVVVTASPIGAALGVVALAGLAISQNWFGVRDLLVGTWEAITSTVTSAVETLQERFDTLKSYLPAALEFAWAEIKAEVATWPGEFLQLGRDVIQGLSDGIMERWENVKASILGIPDQLSSGFRNLLGIQSPSRVFAEIGRWIMEGLGLGIENNSQRAVEATRGVAKEIENVATTAPNVGGALSQTFSEVVRGAAKAEDAVRALEDRLADMFLTYGFDLALNAITGPNGLNLAGALAGGGPVVGGRAYLVGERGPEIFRPQGSGTIIPNHAMGGGGGGVSVPVHVHNYAGAQVDVRQRSGRVDVTVREAVSEVIRSGQADTAMGARYGVRPRARGGS